MNNIFSGIQHFFIALVTTVTTAVMVALPFHRPPIHPTPPPQQNIQVKEEVTPLPSPSVTKQIEQSTRNSQAVKSTITHDGTRTGNIIKYHEWCTGKDISVYENELLEKKGADGKTYNMTQGDWDCFNRANSQPQQNQPAPTQNQQQLFPQNTQRQIVPVNVPTLKETVYCYVDKANEVAAADYALQNVITNFNICTAVANTAFNICNTVYPNDCVSANQVRLDECVRNYSSWNARAVLAQTIAQYCP